MTPLSFRKKVLDFYRKNGRDFPWRPPSLKLHKGRANPYKVLVSEVMLQQTQTHRVVPKYEAFLKAFPSIASLARAPLSRVLKLWQGLGYNRRALMLHRAAQTAVRSHSGQLPVSYEELLQLPGVGPYTAGAVVVFACNMPILDSQGKPVVIIETNIRSALIHEFFPAKKNVTDKKLLPLLAGAVPEKNPREFYQALMDYGAFLKQRYPNPSRRSVHHSTQSRFEGSQRQVRGRILKILSKQKSAAISQLASEVRVSIERCRRAAEQLQEEGFLAVRRGRYRLAE